jgi:hypothetical protein
MRMNFTRKLVIFTRLLVQFFGHPCVSVFACRFDTCATVLPVFSKFVFRLSQNRFYVDTLFFPPKKKLENLQDRKKSALVSCT